MANLPSVFIGSSSEGLNVARAVELHLKDDADITLWRYGLFEPGSGTLERLVRALDEFDFAIMILSPDDLLESRERTYSSPRDNVIFELGLFMARLGSRRTFVIHEHDSNLKLPSDLAGITTSTYRRRENLLAALSSTCYPILEAIRSLSFLERRSAYILEKSGIVNIFADRQDKDLFEVLRHKSQNMHFLRYLSISGRQIFDSTYVHPCRHLISNPSVEIDVLLLNPHSDPGAITHRCKYEKGYSSKDDIEKSLDVYLPKLIWARLEEWSSGSQTAAEQLKEFLAGQRECHDLAVYNTVSVRLYNETPVVHLLGLDDDLFVEQYHLPDLSEAEMRDLATLGCVGRHVPILQYQASKAIGARFLLSHFRRLGKEAGTVDITETLFHQAARQAKDDLS